jgi:hypothetical protein
MMMIARACVGTVATWPTIGVTSFNDKAMIALKAQPAGIDYWIQQLQSYLYAFLIEEYDLQESDYNCYGRVYRNYASDGKEYIPQAFTNNGDYTGVFFEDTVKIQSFFDIGETIKIKECEPTAHLFLYCFMDLQALYGDNAGRRDEEALNEVANFIDHEFSFVLHSKHVGIKKILSDFSGYRKDQASISNMERFYCFRLEIELSNYYICPQFGYLQPAVNLIPFVKDNPSGIDIPIGTFQVDLYNYILSKYNLVPENYNCYARVYRNVVTGSNGREYLPQAYIGNGEYTDILFDDTVALQSFFDIGEAVERSGDDLYDKVHIHLYFFVNLQLLFPNSTERMDIELLNAISQFAMESSPGFELHAQQIGIKKIMEAFTGYKKQRAVKADMQPFYCFRLDMTKRYDSSIGECITASTSSGDHEFAPEEFAPEEFA